MENNSDIFMDSDIRKDVSRIRIKSKSFGEYQDLLIHLLYLIDHQGNNYASKDDIINNLKHLRFIYLNKNYLFLFGLKLYI